MYYTEKDPFTNQKLFVEKDNGKKQKQKDIVTEKRSNNNYKKGSTIMYYPFIFFIYQTLFV